MSVNIKRGEVEVKIKRLATNESKTFIIFFGKIKSEKTNNQWVEADYLMPLGDPNFIRPFTFDRRYQIPKGIKRLKKNEPYYGKGIIDEISYDFAKIVCGGGDDIIQNYIDVQSGKHVKAETSFYEEGEMPSLGNNKPKAGRLCKIEIKKKVK